MNMFTKSANLKTSCSRDSIWDHKYDSFTNAMGDSCTITHNSRCWNLYEAAPHHSGRRLKIAENINTPSNDCLFIPISYENGRGRSFAKRALTLK
jgi:hypothetical protein